MKLIGKPVLNIGINKKGIDYIVGDLHGKFDKLIEKLRSIGFDKSKDRLFSVGDLIDRGEDSLKCFELLSKDWFFAVRGNHCQAAIDYSKGQMTRLEYNQWGGGWFIELPDEQRQSIAAKLSLLPWVIQLKTANGIIGIVHSQPVKLDARYNWQRFIKSIKDDEMLRGFKTARSECTFDRSIVSNETELKGNITGVLAVVGGHSTLQEPLKQYNFYCIDTGACYNQEGYGYFTLLRADTLEFI